MPSAMNILHVNCLRLDAAHHLIQLMSLKITLLRPLSANNDGASLEEIASISSRRLPVVSG